MNSFDPIRLRADFPALATSRGRAPIYLDTACMALKPRQVIEASNAYYGDFPACHGRTFHTFGRRTTQAVDGARRTIARFVGAADDGEVVFLKNVTEGLNLLAAGLDLGPGDTVITTGMEHNSNLLPWQREARRKDFQHLVVPLTPEGELDQDAFEEALDSARVRLVSVFHTSNVTGVTLPAEWIVDQAHRRGALVAFDGAQAMPHHPIDLRALGADFYLFSFYKMLGPTGVAALYGRRRLLERIPALLVGGEGILDATYFGYTAAPLPDRFESGLQNYAGILGAEAAVRYLERLDRGAALRHEARLNEVLTGYLSDIPGARIIGPQDPARRGSVVNFHLEGLDSMELARVLDSAHRIMIRAGRHCAHSWYNATNTGDSVRVSFYVYNTEEEAHILGRTLMDVAREFRS